MFRQSLDWLSLTPEPERDLPAACATLRAGGHPSAKDVAAERRRAEGEVLRGNRGTWLHYLDEAAALVPSTPPDQPELRQAAVVVAEVVLNHHKLLAGFPGPAYERSALQRRRLEAFLEVADGRCR